MEENISEKKVNIGKKAKVGEKTKTDEKANADEQNKTDEKKKVDEQNKTDENISADDVVSISKEEIKVYIEKTAKAEETRDRLLRLTAEFDNFRKRTQKEKDSLYRDGMASAAQSFLPLADNIERCIDAAADDANVQEIKKGMDMILKQLKDILKAMSIEEISAVGEEFNPELHEAVMHIEDDAVDTNIVMEEFKKGYMMNGKVIRHSMVKVAN